MTKHNGYLTPRSLSIVTVLPVIPIVNVVDLVKVVHILIALWIIDLGTGLIASYFFMVKKQLQKVNTFGVSGNISIGFQVINLKSFVRYYTLRFPINCFKILLTF
jgi:hypothetical protein